MLIKQKLCSYHLRKVVFQKWIIVVSIVSRFVVILFSVRKCQRWVHCHYNKSKKMFVEMFCSDAVTLPLSNQD